MVRFTPLFTYKVLKRNFRLNLHSSGFTPLFTYKVLKLDSSKQLWRWELYTFIYLQGSQTCQNGFIVLSQLYTFIYLQGSQTYSILVYIYPSLYTFIYLQGSQTSVSPTLR